MRVHSKYLFTVLFALTGLISIWMRALFFIKLIMYKQFCNHAVGKSAQWRIVSVAESHHHVCVDYSFKIDSKTYTAEHLFLKPTYQSRETAEYAKEAMEKETIDVWYRWPANSPTPFSIVERSFPTNELFRFSIALAILSYFVFLRRYFSHFDERASVGNKGAL